MATFLTNSKMNPALAARVEASVRGHRKRPRASLVRRIVSFARLALVLTVGFALYTAVTLRRKDRHELERSRTQLLEAVRVQSATLAPADRGALPRIETWLGRLAGGYEGDLVADELRAPAALPARLARPIVYVRGPIDSFQSSAQIGAAAGVSSKDALLLCLKEPPASRTEAVLLEKVRVTYAGGAGMEERTANVRRLDDAIVGLPILLPPWAERVRGADDAAEVSRLRKQLERAPIERAKQAAKAELLLVALDEPGNGSVQPDPDGERPHDVRIALVDLVSSTVLLRLRRPVDPSWISPAKRATHASGLDGCALAFDIHEALRKKVP